MRRKGGRLRSVTARRGALLLIAFLPPPAAAAPPMPAMKLGQAVRLGLANDPDLRAAKLDVSAAGTEISIARSGYYPSVSVSGGPQGVDFGDVTYDVTAAQMLYDWGRTGARVEGARALERQAAAEALVRRDEAALDIAETYLDLLRAERHLDADRRHIDALAAVLEMTQARAAGGYSDRSEPERAALELARARERLAEDEGQYRDLRNQFALLVGAPPGALEEPDPDPFLLQDMRAGLDAAIPAAPLYRKAVEDSRQSEAAAKAARASLLPQLNVEASTLRRDLGGRAQSDTMVGLRFRMDTFQGLSGIRRAEAAAQRREAARFREGAVARDLRREVTTMADTAEMLRAREETLAAQVDGSATLGALYREQFRVGRRDVIDLVNVQRERFEAERQWIAVRIERLRLHYRMAARLGLIDRLIAEPAA